jgi:hypothetical protein
LIILGLVAVGLGIALLITPGGAAREQTLGLWFGLSGSLALIAGLATCDIVNAIQGRRRP